MATLPGAWHYRVSAGTGRPSVSILWLGEMESLICNFYLVWQHIKLSEQIRPWGTLACCWDVKRPTNKLLFLTFLDHCPHYPVCRSLLSLFHPASVFLDPYEYHTDLCNELCLAGWTATQLAVLFSKNFNIEHYMQTVSTSLFHSCHAYRHHLLLPFSTTFSDLDYAWSYKVSVKQPLLASFSCTVSSDQDKIWCGDEAIQFEHSEATFEQDLVKQGE